MGADGTGGRGAHRRRRDDLAPHLLRGAAAALVATVLVTAFYVVTSRDGDAGVQDRQEQAAPRAIGTPFASLVDEIGISRDNSAANVDLDGAGHSLSSQALAAAGWTPGREVVLLGTELELPDYAPGRPDHVVSDGQLLRLDEDRYGSLTFLATATRTGGAGGGPAVHGTGRVVYTDGTEQEFVLSVPDWVEGPAGDAALSLPYANSAGIGGPSPTLGSVRLYARSVPVDPAREVSHVVLPRVDGDGGRLHLFSVDGRPSSGWTGSWARATSGYLEVGPWQDQTLRLSVRTTAGGHVARIRLDNTFAAEPVTVGAASLALQGDAAGTRGAAVPLTFDGRADTVIPAGGQVFSDPVEILLPPHTDVLVSYHLPELVTAAPVHYAAVDTNYSSEPGSGDQTLDTTGAPFTGRVAQWPFLTGIEVADGPGAILAFGDSLTDGTRSTHDAHSRWPDVLSTRLAAQP
ncbi:SGNH/GDSL hydrolase family protein, partial [Nocardiopsis tropica]|nr:SGNH/GDSL hydrolase family protein [Nocardiopsis tropica]